MGATTNEPPFKLNGVVCHTWRDVALVVEDVLKQRFEEEDQLALTDMLVECPDMDVEDMDRLQAARAAKRPQDIERATVWAIETLKLAER